MLTNTSIEIPLKPRVLIADDSRIVRATLIKHIQHRFEYREALDGEQAWETLLIDPNIRVVITDLTMPKLDGYGLLQRIRASKIHRIRTIPVVVVSGSDDEEERDRARAAGATDLITKGIDTTQLLSRLDILSKLVNIQLEFERNLEAQLKQSQSSEPLELSSPQSLASQAETMLANAIRLRKNFVLLEVCVGLKHPELQGAALPPPPLVVSTIGQLLQATVRQTDSVAQTGEATFTLATGNIHLDSAQHFAQRICRVIDAAILAAEQPIALIVSCGVAALAEFIDDPDNSAPSIDVLRELVHQRALLGLHHGVSGVIGIEQVASIKAGASAATVIAESAHDLIDGAALDGWMASTAPASQTQPPMAAVPSDLMDPDVAGRATPST